MGSSSSHGYGDLRLQGRKWLAHRYSYELYRSPIPHGLHVLHRCDVPCCVNPEHLFVGTNSDNIADSKRKGRRKYPNRIRPTGLKYARRSSTAYDSLRKLSPEQIKQAKAMYFGGGISIRALGRIWGVGYATARRYVSH